MSKNKTFQIRNSTAEFLIFTRQAGESTIKSRGCFGASCSDAYGIILGFFSR